MEILKKIERSSDGYTPKIIETPKFLIINGQLYDKTNLNPLKFESVDLTDLSFSSWGPILRRCINTCYDYAQRYFQLQVKNLHYHFVEDSSYPNRFYLMTQKNTCGAWFREYEECKDEETGKYYYKLLYNTSVGESVAVCNGHFHCGDYEIMYQNDDYIIGKYNYPNINDMYEWKDWGSNNNILFRYNKETFGMTTIHEAHRLEDASYNYYYLKHMMHYDYVYIQYLLKHYIIRYDSISGAVTTIYDNAETGVQISGNPVQIDDWYYYYVDEYKRTGHYGYQLCRVRFEESTAEYEYISIEDNKQMDIDPSNIAMANVTHPLSHESKTIILNNGYKYIVTVARSQPNGNWYPTQHKLVVLKLEEDKAIVKQVVNFSGDPCKGVLSYYEEEGHADILLTLHRDSIKFWKFDYEQEKYIVTYEKAGHFYWYGMDEQYRIYMQYADYGLEMIDKAETATLKAYFKEKVIAENQNTATLCYWSKDYFNEYTSEKVVIRLSEGLEFQDGTTQKDFMTSTGGPLEVTVNITATTNIKAEAEITVSAL